MAATMDKNYTKNKHRCKNVGIQLGRYCKTVNETKSHQSNQKTDKSLTKL